MIVIHSGNFELLCFRHRRTQTLYISDILHVPFLEAPSYSKIQTGFYIAAVEDALARNNTDRQHGLVPAPAVSPASPRKRPKVNKVDDHVSVSPSSVRGIFLTNHDVYQDATSVFKHQAQIRNYLVVNSYDMDPQESIYKRVDVAWEDLVESQFGESQSDSGRTPLMTDHYETRETYHTTHVDTFLRLRDHADGLSSRERGLTLDRLSRLHEEEGVLMLDGWLSLVEDCGRGFELHISAKVAHTKAHKVALRKEAALRQQCVGIASSHRFFGLFGDDSEEGGGRLWLIQAFAGTSLLESGETITEHQRYEF